MKEHRMIPLFRVNMSPEAPSKVSDVLMSGYIGQGQKVEEFEASLQEILRTETRPVTVNSCTSALDLALELIGVGPGDYVISTPLTCFASNSPILKRGAHIVWADIDPLTGLIDPDSVKSRVEEHLKLGVKIKCIMAVDWAGRLCDFKALKSNGIPVIEDAAHRWELPTQEIFERGDYIAYSFQAIKFLTTGDGGCLITPLEKEHDARLLRWYGLDRTKGESFRCTQNIKTPGFKYHMNDIAAAIGLCNIKQTKENLLKHINNAELMSKLLYSVSYLNTPPPTSCLNECSYWLYSLILSETVDRSNFIEYLSENGISSSPVHFRNDIYDCTADYKLDLPGVSSFNRNQINIPIGWWLEEREVYYIANVIRRYQ